MTESARVLAARQRAERRGSRAGDQMRPVVLAVALVVVLSSVSAAPRPSLHGSGAVVLTADALFAAGIAVIARRGRPPVLPAVLGVLLASAVALSATQSDGPGSIAGSVPVFVAFLWLPRRQAMVLTGVAAVATVVAGIAGTSAGAGDAIGNVVLYALMAVVALLLRRSREDQQRTEVLYAELQDARDAQAQAAAIAERGRIAGELHDVLAHSLSGAAIQLQGARRVLARDDVDPAATAAVDRAAELVRDGLADARRAVGALRGDALPTVEALPALIASLRDDLALDVAYEVRGTPAALSPEAGLALFRGAQEALTNAARHAPGGAVTATLEHAPGGATLEVADGGRSGDVPAADDIAGGGHGLQAMRERVARAGGTVDAGPDGPGWRVRIEVPAG